jgi:hypothetical protein
MDMLSFHPEKIKLPDDEFRSICVYDRFDLENHLVFAFEWGDEDGGSSLLIFNKVTNRWLVSDSTEVEVKGRTKMKITVTTYDSDDAVMKERSGEVSSTPAYVDGKLSCWTTAMDEFGWPEGEWGGEPDPAYMVVQLQDGDHVEVRQYDMERGWYMKGERS